MQPVVDHAYAQEQRPRNETVAEHQDHRAFEALRIEGEKADRDDRHMRDRGIGDQLLHVLLHQRNQRGRDHRDHRQDVDQHRELRARIGEHRQAEADEAVAAHLEENAREDD